jgi:hypothetical protein
MLFPGVGEAWDAAGDAVGVAGTGLTNAGADALADDRTPVPPTLASRTSAAPPTRMSTTATTMGSPLKSSLHAQM